MAAVHDFRDNPVAYQLSREIWDAPHPREFGRLGRSGAAPIARTGAANRPHRRLRLTRSFSRRFSLSSPQNPTTCAIGEIACGVFSTRWTCPPTTSSAETASRADRPSMLAARLGFARGLAWRCCREPDDAPAREATRETAHPQIEVTRSCIADFHGSISLAADFPGFASLRWSPIPSRSSHSLSSIWRYLAGATGSLCDTMAACHPYHRAAVTSCRRSDSTWEGRQAHCAIQWQHAIP